MAEEKNTHSEPEDILSATEADTGVSDITYRTPALRRRKKRHIGSKVVLFMGVTVLLFVVVGVTWFFFPTLSGFFSSLKISDDSQNLISDSSPTSVQTTSPPSSPLQATITEVDSDRDGLPDTQEDGLGLDSNNPDTDGDGLSDRDEVAIYNTDPRNPDSDGDGFSDGSEVHGGYDPNGPGRLDDIFRVIGTQEE